MQLKKLNLPEYNFRISKEKETLLIFDALRKKELVLTPEEWVRQNLIQFLIKEKKYPEGLVSIEAGLKLNTLQKRYDVLIYSRNGEPLLLIECKAPEVTITKKVFEQILAYNSQIMAPHLLVSNGLVHYFLRRDEKGKFQFESNLPFFGELSYNSID